MFTFARNRGGGAAVQVMTVFSDATLARSRIDGSDNLDVLRALPLTTILNVFPLMAHGPALRLVTETLSFGCVLDRRGQHWDGAGAQSVNEDVRGKVGFGYLRVIERCLRHP